jgi:hypothetical protein
MRKRNNKDDARARQPGSQFPRQNIALVQLSGHCVKSCLRFTVFCVKWLCLSRGASLLAAPSPDLLDHRLVEHSRWLTPCLIQRTKHELFIAVG